MERIYKLTYSLLVLALLSLTQQSCIKEDMDDCPTCMRVFFDYHPRTYASIKEGINPGDVKQMNIYWFDAKTNVLLGTETDQSPALSTDYYITIPKLKNGEYKFIAWGNLTGDYATNPATLEVGSTTIDEVTTYLQKQDSIRTRLTPLFFGQTGTEKVKNGVTPAEVHIPLVQDTYTFNVEAKGQLNENSRYRMVISDNNGKLGFNNSYQTTAPGIHYVAEALTPDKNGVKGTLTTLRVSEERSPMLRIFDMKNNSKPIFETNLVKLILELEKQHKIEIDFSQMYEFDIEIIIDYGSFTITINGWTIVYTEDELHG